MRRALRLGVRQDRPRRARPRRCTPPASRSCRPARRRRAIAEAGVAGHGGRRASPGFPESLDGRVKTLHPRVHAGPPRRPAPRPTTGRSSGSSASSRSSSSWSTCTRSSRRSRPGASQRRVHRADRHRRPVDGAGAAKNHANVAVVTSPGQLRRRRSRRSRRAGFTLAQRAAARRRGVRAHGDLRHRGRLLDGQRSLAPTADGSGFPAWVGAACDRVDGPALRRELAPARRALHVAHFPGGLAGRRAAARQGDVVQQLRRRRRRPPRRLRLRRAGRGDHQARQPVRHRGRRATSPRPTRARTRRDPVSAFGGVIAANRPVTAGDGRARSPTSSPRWSSRPASSADALELLTTKKNLRLLRRPAGAARAGAEIRPITGGLLLQSPDRIDAPGDDPSAWTLACGEPADDATLRRPRVRLAGVPRR